MPQEIKILGSICGSCERLEKNVRSAAAKLNLQASIIKITGIEAMVAANVTRIPALIVNGQLYSQGRVVKEKELIKLFSDNQKQNQEE